MLSMIEKALKISDNQINTNKITKIIEYGKALIDSPIKLIDNIDLVLKKLQGRYKIIIATKGDLLDQKRKLVKSGLKDYFHNIEIMNEKKEQDYLELMQKLSIVPKDFLMVGNSLKSSVLPVLAIGGSAIHVPFHITWQYENQSVKHDNNIITASNITELPEILMKINKT